MAVNPYNTDSEADTGVEAIQNGQSSSADRPPMTVHAWMICGLLLLASAINYMDRQTLAMTSHTITEQFSMSQEQYGDLEAGFGWAFAVGSLFFGFLSDRIPVRWLYPMVLLAWSAVGFATGYTNGYHSLLWLRILLGFFEAGHWPCGVKAVRSLLDARGRTLGNGLLQSGTSIGAIVTPLAMLAMLTDEPGSWRRAFQVIASIGVLWIICWFATVRRNDVDTVRATKQVDRDPWWNVLKQRRMWIVLCVIALINTTWQLMRAWLPKFMQEGHGYSQEAMLSFNAVWFAATDISCLGVGFVVIALAKRGWNLHHARLCAFFACSVCCLSTLVLPWLDAGGMLLALLLIAGAGALGVFPIYHAYTQDISGAHQGKVTGIAGVAAWAFSPLAQKLFGRLIDNTGSFNGFAVIGCLPLVAGIILYLFWGSDKKAGD